VGREAIPRANTFVSSVAAMSRVRHQRSSLLAKPLANMVGFLADESMYVTLLPFSRLGTISYDCDKVNTDVSCAIVFTRIMMAGMFYRSTSYSDRSHADFSIADSRTNN
jgi:hypothetical protein